MYLEYRESLGSWACYQGVWHNITSVGPHRINSEKDPPWYFWGESTCHYRESGFVRLCAQYFYLLSVVGTLPAPTAGDLGLGGWCCWWVGFIGGSFPVNVGVTTAYRSRSSYSSLRPVETELPRLSLPNSGEDGCDVEVSDIVRNFEKPC